MPERRFTCLPRGDELVDDDLGAVHEVAELRSQQVSASGMSSDSRSRTHHARLAERRVEDVEVVRPGLRDARSATGTRAGRRAHGPALHALAHLREAGPLDIFDSPLSEAGVMGFDYGWSLDMPEALTCWEAQFGDFVNGAQIVIDQFITSAEDKWNPSRITLLLPHGLEARARGTARRASSASSSFAPRTTSRSATRPRRRRSSISSGARWSGPGAKPLIVMTPKSLLRHKQAVSLAPRPGERSFQRIIVDPAAKKATRALLCTGKIYYDLIAAREAKKRDDVAIVRFEQLYPLSDALLAETVKPFKGAELFWVQEEPFNMGAWYHVRARWPEVVGREG